MKRTIKLLTSLLLIIGIAYSFGIKTHAQEKSGSIKIILEDVESDMSKKDVEFAITKIADIIDGTYIILDEFSDYDIDLNDIQTAEQLRNAAKQMKRYISVNDHIGKTNEEGILEFNELSVGVYLIHATNINEYELIEPTIVSLPIFNESNGEMDYEITILPKHSPLPIIEINKVDADTDKLIINRQFEFTLYSDEECTNVIKTFRENIDGIIEFDIYYGTYYLKETKAPLGYHLSDEVLKIRFHEDGLYFNDELYQSDNGRYSYDFENIKISTHTPSTGDNTNILLWQCLIALSIIAVGVLAAIKDNKNEEK